MVSKIRKVFDVFRFVVPDVSCISKFGNSDNDFKLVKNLKRVNCNASVLIRINIVRNGLLYHHEERP